jgi:hypothetical protein
MRRTLITLVATLFLVGAPVSPARATPPGAVTWTVDHVAKTITVLVKLQIYPGCSGNPRGEAEDQAKACQGVNSQVTQFLADKIKHQSEGVWNRGYHYRCYTLIVIVDVKLAPDRDHLDPDRVAVMIDPSFAGIRDFVSWDSSGPDWQSNDPSAIGETSADGSVWGEQSQLEATTYAHELGHVIGLDDAYHDVKDPQTGKARAEINPGAPDDLMSTGATNIDQSTIDRLIERNRNNLRDTRGNPVGLKDLVCPEFMATLAGKEIDHTGSAFKYTTAALCGGGQTLKTSEDQTVSFISSEVHVDAVKVTNPPPGWPDVDVLLVPHGVAPERIVLGPGPGIAGLEPTLFKLPAQFSVDRSNSKPGLAPMPSVVDLGYQPCAGGGGTGGGGNDCGHREFAADMAMTLAAAHVLLPQLENPGGLDLSGLYKSCTGPDPVPGLFAISEGGGATVTGGAVPVAKLLDPDVDKIDIPGSATLTEKRLGRWVTRQYDWLLILCRIRDGVPAC